MYGCQNKENREKTEDSLNYISIYDHIEHSCTEDL